MAETKPEWVQIKPAELHKLIIELHKAGNSPAKIGLILRDQHGIPKAKVLGKRITQILEEANLHVQSRLEEVKKEISNIEGHISKNSHDYSAKRSLNKKQWVVHRLTHA